MKSHLVGRLLTTSLLFIIHFVPLTNQSTCSTVMLPLHDTKAGTAIHAFVYAIHLDVLRRILQVHRNRTFFSNLKRWPPLIKTFNRVTQSVQPERLLFTSSANKQLFASSDFKWYVSCFFRTSQNDEYQNLKIKVPTSTVTREHSPHSENEGH